MLILPVEPSDSKELTNLINRAYRSEKSGWTTERHLLDGDRIEPATFQEALEIPDSSFLKYLDDYGELIGCVHLQKKDTRLYLGMLTVAPDRQGQGVGKTLLLVAEEYAKTQGCIAIYMTVISARQDLIDWYIRHGYIPTGETEPFHEGTRFGRPRIPLELIVLEKK